MCLYMQHPCRLWTRCSGASLRRSGDVAGLQARQLRQLARHAVQPSAAPYAKGVTVMLAIASAFAGGACGPDYLWNCAGVAKTGWDIALFKFWILMLPVQAE